jgi:UDPglucose 6-dehydrogenase
MSIRPSPSIGFAGLSHLGIVYSAVAAAKGFPVIAFDPRPGVAADLDAGRLPVREPGLEDLLATHRSRLRYTVDVSDLAACDVIFFSFDVPTDDAGLSDLAPLTALIDQLTAVARPETTLVMLSQVPPGFTRQMERSAARRRLQTFYQVETLIFGNAVERALEPERYMVGCEDPKAGFPDPYRTFLEAFGCPILPMGYESAELCKIAINCFLVASVSATNMLAEICEGLGADWNEIAPALRLDRRIGPHAYLGPGLGIAGGNLERDLATIGELAAELGTDTRLIRAWQQNSAYRKEWALRLLYREGLLADPASARLAVWGVAYKPDTHSVKNSPSITLLRALRAYQVAVYDPAARPDPEDLLRIEVCDTALGAIQGADVLVVMTAWQEFATVPIEEVAQSLRGKHLLDPYGILDGARARELGLLYFRLGARTEVPC